MSVFEESLVKPLNRGYREIDTAKQAIANDYKSLNKRFPDVKKMLTEKTPDKDFTYEIRNLNVNVAALLTTDMIARRLDDVAPFDEIIITIFNTPFKAKFLLSLIDLLYYLLSLDLKA